MSGDTIDLPISANFREAWSRLEYDLRRPQGPHRYADTLHLLWTVDA